MKIIILIAFIILFLLSCGNKNKPSSKPIVPDSNQEVIEMNASAIADCSAKNDTLFEELE
jgi:PBP1b-binding outer membrane lipoprotein LpoB